MAKKIMLCLICVCSFFLFAPIESKAADYKYTMSVPYGNPATNEYSGYCSIYARRNSDGVIGKWTYFWNVAPDPDKGNASSFPVGIVHLEINSVGGFFFNYSIPLNSTGNNVTLGVYDGGSLSIISSGWRSSSYRNGWNFSGYTILAYQLGGFYSSCSASGSMSALEVHWNDSVDASQLNTKLDNLYNGLTDIETVELEGNQILFGIKTEVQESNKWLEDIYDNLEQSAENEKNEATAQGNSSVSEGNSAITDNSAGFIDSLGKLTSSMSYNGTQCAWTFPEIKLPAISGVMDEVVLIQEQPIDFSYWVNKIPANVLLLIQSVCTVSLIIYCFKELYGTISYMLTLGKDSDS